MDNAKPKVNTRVDAQSSFLYAVPTLTFPELDTETNVRAMAEFAPCIEVTLDYGFNLPLTDDLVRRLVAAKEELGLEYTVHLPLTINLASLNDLVREASVETVRRVLVAARPLEARAYALHVTPIYKPEGSSLGEEFAHKQLKQVLGVARESLEKLLPLVGNPRRLCVENIWASLYLLYEEVVRPLDLGVCLDLGHLLLDSKSPVEYLRLYRDQLEHIHLHDVVNGRDHLPLGSESGTLDLDGVVQTLFELDYQGVVVHELFHVEHIKQSLSTFRKAIERAETARRGAAR